MKNITTISLLSTCFWGFILTPADQLRKQVLQSNPQQARARRVVNTSADFNARSAQRLQDKDHTRQVQVAEKLSKLIKRAGNSQTLVQISMAEIEDVYSGLRVDFARTQDVLLSLLRKLHSLVHVSNHDVKIARALKDIANIKTQIIEFADKFYQIAANKQVSQTEVSECILLGGDLEKTIIKKFNKYTQDLVGSISNMYGKYKKSCSGSIKLHDLLDQEIKQLKAGLDKLDEELQDLYTAQEHFRSSQSTLYKSGGKDTRYQQRSQAALLASDKGREASRKKEQFESDIAEKKREKVSATKRKMALQEERTALKNLTDCMRGFDNDTIFLLNNDALVDREDIGRLSAEVLESLYDTFASKGRIKEVFDKIGCKVGDLSQGARDILQRYILYAYNDSPNERIKAKGFIWELAVGLFLEKKLSYSPMGNVFNSFSCRHAAKDGGISVEFDMAPPRC